MEKWKKFKEDTAERYRAEFDYMDEHPLMYLGFFWKWVSIGIWTVVFVASCFCNNNDEVEI